MQAKDEKRDLRYCRYYHGEQQNPYMDAFKGRAWIAEELASERASDSAKDFLSFVAAHISKWEPYGYEPDVARYIAFSDCCSLEERLEIARAYRIGDALLLQKPQGETVFESFFIGQGFASSIVNKGVLLYPDGSVYIENVDRRDFERANPVYFYVGKYQETADAVKRLIDENWERISALSSKIDDAVCDGQSYFAGQFHAAECRIMRFAVQLLRIDRPLLFRIHQDQVGIGTDFNGLRRNVQDLTRTHTHQFYNVL